MRESVNLNCLNCNKSLPKANSKYCSKECHIDHKPKTIIKNCNQCNKEFKVFSFQIRNGDGRFCSKKCYGLTRLSERVIKKCIHCDISFTLPPCKIKYGYGTYCSKHCSNEHQSAIKNFFNKVKKEADCWIWEGCKGKTGYGKLIINRKFKSAHRLSWEMRFGEIPINTHVLHKCDNPSCVNPDHLFLGTHQDNMADMVQKDRQGSREGQKHHKAKLNDEKVKLIRQKISEGQSNLSLAKEFNVDPVTISHIKVKRTWRHV